MPPFGTPRVIILNENLEDMAPITDFSMHEAPLAYMAVFRQASLKTRALWSGCSTDKATTTLILFRKFILLVALGWVVGF